MQIIIAGGSGFIGRHLTLELQRQGHRVTILTRDKKGVDGSANDVIEWDGKRIEMEPRADCIINLCGERIDKNRWTTATKQRLINSRTQPTQAIVDYIQQYPGKKKPRLLNASAIGIYPSHNHPQTEHTTLDNTHALFSQQLVQQWEHCAMQARALDAEVTCLDVNVVQVTRPLALAEARRSGGRDRLSSPLGTRWR